MQTDFWRPVIGAQLVIFAFAICAFTVVTIVKLLHLWVKFLNFGS